MQLLKVSFKYFMRGDGGGSTIVNVIIECSLIITDSLANRLRLRINFPYRKLLAGFRPVESGESRNGVCSLGSAGKALFCSSSNRLYDLTPEVRLDIKDLKEIKGKFDKENLIHMFNMVLGGHDYLIIDTDLMLKVGRHIREAYFI